MARVYFAKNIERTEFAGILDISEEAAKSGKRVFIFVDLLSRHLTSLIAIKHRLASAKNVTIVVAERTNRFASISHALAELTPIEVVMPDLDAEDVKEIIAKLEAFGFLGALRDKTPQQRIDAFMERANKQLLVALREATGGDGFGNILQNEYGELVPAAKLAYTICCIAVAHGAPGVYMRHLLPCLGRAEFSRAVIIKELLRGVLVPCNASDTMVKPRHRLIAHWVANEIAPTGIKNEAIGKFLQQISADIVPNEIRRRTPAYLAYRGMINSEHLKETFAGDHEVILGLYEELKPYYDRDFLFWLQYGMAQINAGRLDVAENYINQSLSMNQNSHQTKHQLGCLCLLKAVRAPNPAFAIEQAHKGIELLMEQIRTKGDENSYPYHAYLIHVTRWYQRAGTLITQAEWEGLRAIGKEARNKYSRDDMIRDAIKETERQYMLKAAVDKPNA
ncbi:MAG: hypothetical protein QM775_34240 [Pirellulales bacterium]